MGSLALAGKAAAVQIGDTLPPQPVTYVTKWTEITEVYEIGDINVNRAVYDATFHGPSIYRDQTVGLVDAISITLACNYVQAQYQIFWDLANDTAATGPLRWFRVLWPDGFWHRFEGYVAGVTAMTPLDERITYNVTLACTQDFFYEDTIPTPPPTVISIVGSVLQHSIPIAVLADPGGIVSIIGSLTQPTSSDVTMEDPGQIVGMESSRFQRTFPEAVMDIT